MRLSNILASFIAAFVLLPLQSCNELQQVVNQLPNGALSETEIAAGLTQALENGVEKEVSKLAEENGFYQDPLVKILLPEELQRVDRTLRQAGLEDLAEEGLKLLNRAAEDAVAEGTPIFFDAIRGISFREAREILMGPDSAATSYLRQQTADPLYQRFEPIIRNSLDKVGANRVWRDLIERYNALPLTREVNPDLADHVTQEALSGVFTRIAVEEKEIRTTLSARTSELLRRVFALQDS